MRLISARASFFVIALLAVLVGVAGAQDAKPAPDCQGVSVTDPAGDAERASTQPSPGNMDIKGVFFTYEGGKTYANLQLADANDTLPPAAQGARWYIIFTAKKAERWVRAYRNLGEETSFSYGHFEDTTRTTDGEIQGKFFTGPDGVLKLEIPAAAGGASGEALTQVYADTAEAVGVPSVRMQLVINDRGPDGEAFGKSYSVNGCAAGGDPGAGGGGTGGGTGGGGGGGGGGGSTNPPPPSGQPIVEAAVLPVKASGKGGSAKKVSKKRKLSLAIESSQPVKDLVAKLFTGDPAKPKVISTAKLASLNGKGKLNFRIKKKLKKGTVSLRVDGTLADGRKGVANFKVKFGK